MNVIVLPTYNERENLRHALARIREVADGHGVQLHTLIVDDNSPDGTGDLADELAREVPDVSVLHRAGKEGLGKAYIAGFREALAMGAERIFEMDADLSHDASYLPHFLRLIDQGADLVLGSRYVKGGGVENWGLSRKVISRGGCLYAQTILGLPLHDLTGGFKCFRRAVLETIDLDAGGHQGLRLPDRDDLPRLQAGLQGRRAAHHLRRPQGGREQDEQRHRARGHEERLEAPLQPRPHAGGLRRRRAHRTSLPP